MKQKKKCPECDGKGEVTGLPNPVNGEINKKIDVSIKALQGIKDKLNKELKKNEK